MIYFERSTFDGNNIIYFVENDYSDYIYLSNSDVERALGTFSIFEFDTDLCQTKLAPSTLDRW